MEKEQYEQEMDYYFKAISTLVLNNRYLYRNPNKFNFNPKERFIKQTELLNSTLTLLSLTNELFILQINKKTLLDLIKKEELKIDELSFWLEKNYVKHKENISKTLSKIEKKETNAIKECERFMNNHFDEMMEVSHKIKLYLNNDIYVVKLRNVMDLIFDLFTILINAFISGFDEGQEEKVKSLINEIDYLKKWIQTNISSKIN
jgi:hypothetical protein